MFRDGAHADENGNGTGEFGSFAELAGAVPVRGGKKLDPAVMSTAFRVVRRSRVERSGYKFQVFLALPGGHARSERAEGGFAKGDADPALAERFWCAYAWPLEHGETGNRTFFINQEGDILATDEAGYSGSRGPPPIAAFAPRSGGVTGTAAANAKGCDGNVWQQVG